MVYSGLCLKRVFWTWGQLSRQDISLIYSFVHDGESLSCGKIHGPPLVLDVFEKGLLHFVEAFESGWVRRYFKGELFANLSRFLQPAIGQSLFSRLRKEAIIFVEVSDHSPFELFQICPQFGIGKFNLERLVNVEKSVECWSLGAGAVDRLF